MTTITPLFRKINLKKTSTYIQEKNIGNKWQFTSNSYTNYSNEGFLVIINNGNKTQSS